MKYILLVFNSCSRDDSVMYSWKHLFVYIAVITVRKTYADKDASASVIGYRNDKLDDGYIYEYITSNGISRREIAQFSKDTKSKNPKEEVLRVTGFYSYKDAQGKDHRVDYSADENGFVARSHISTKAQAHGSQRPVNLPAGIHADQGSFQVSKGYDVKGISSKVLASLGG